MTDPTPTTVAVPKELLKRAIADGGQTDILDEMRDLLPKPTPRLVAFDFDDWAEDPRNLKIYIESQPDLLTLLDEAIDTVPYLGVAGIGADIKSRIRAALGATE